MINKLFPKVFILQLFLFLVIISLYLQFFLCNIVKAGFGDSCVSLPRVDNSGYLVTDTAYGYLMNHIDMTINIPNVTNGCVNDGDTLRFCVRDGIDSSSCTPQSLSLGNQVSLSSFTNNPDLSANPLLSSIVLSAEELDNYLCLMMLTSRGEMPLICREYNSSSNPVIVDPPICYNLGDSCYESGKSQSLINFSGNTIHCVQQTLDKVFYNGNICVQPDDDEPSLSMLNPFPNFQESLKTAIRAALIIYVIFYGFKIVLNNEYVHLNNVAIFIFKFIFVVYFSIGFGKYYDQNGQIVSYNGMTWMVLPALLQLTSSFTEMIFLAGGTQGLCHYDSSKYEAGYEFYKVWDAIDCRVGYYFGVQSLYDLNISDFFGTGSTSVNIGNSANFGPVSIGNGFDSLNKPGVFTFFALMFGFFLSGKLMLVLSGIIFGVVFISVIFYFLNVYLVSTITLYVMVYVSPIFVPMLLFERTKIYFDSWVKVIISATLQPAVVGGFVAMLLTMYDSVFFENCEFLRHDYTSSGINFSTFELRVPSIETEKCKGSAGYKLIQYYLGEGWERLNLILFEIVLVDDSLDLMLSLLYMIVYVFMFYYAVQFINEFISDLTSGPSMAAVTVSPTAAIDRAKRAARALQSLATKGAQIAKGAANNKQKNNDAEGKGEGGGVSRPGISAGASSGSAEDKFAAAAAPASDAPEAEDKFSAEGAGEDKDLGSSSEGSGDHTSGGK